MPDRNDEGTTSASLAKIDSSINELNLESVTIALNYVRVSMAPECFTKLARLSGMDSAMDQEVWGKY
jgi:hypothetical protein